MANQHGTPVWYELLTPDHDRARRFYEDVVGWTIPAPPSPAPGGMDYRTIVTPDGGKVGGVMELSDAMTSGGAKPGWLFYIGVDDVDATADRINAAGGAVLMPPFDIPDVGRAAFVADPQGAPFYIMRGDGTGDSTAFSADPVVGHCGWNELWTSDAAGALAFYKAVFGWESPHSMPMGPGREYHFVLLGETALGAIGPSQNPDQSARWTFYFMVPDVDAALARAEAAGGTVVSGPHDVPGPMRVFTGTDHQGASFALVGPAREN